MKQLIAGILAGFFVISPLAAVRADDAPSLLDATLDNGLRVVVVVNHLAPVVTTSLTYNVGGVDDSMPGIAHATEHMLFRGTTTVSSDQFAAIATRIGAQYNAETTALATRFYFTVPSSYLGAVLRLEADRMENARISQADWNNERGAIEQEVKGQLSNPLLPVEKRVEALFYGDSPWGRNPVGTVASFDKMNAADIAAFYHTWYHPNNATLVIVGDVDAQQTLDLVKTSFGMLKTAALPEHPKFPQIALPSTTIAETVDFPIPVAIVAFKLPGFESADYAPTQVLFTALESKRAAFSDLVLSGKALFALPAFSVFPEEGSGFVVTALRPGSDPNASLADIAGILNSYAKDGIPDDLIEAAKSRLLASKAYEGASIPGQAEEWSIARAFENQTPAAQYDALSKVTAADVNRVFHSYVTDRNRVTLALSAKPGASLPHADKFAPTENVKVTSNRTVALPDWTKVYFAAPLRAPSEDRKSTVFTLKNGLTVVIHTESFSPTVVIKGDVSSNPDLYEPRGKEGVSLLTSSMLGLGTTEHDVKAFQRELDAIAASVYAGSSFSAESRSADFDRTVQLLAETMLRPSFASDEFSVASKNASQSLRAFEGRPENKAQLARLYALYPPNDPHRRHPTSRSISAVTLDDVKRWYRFAYRPDLTTISVVGDVSPQQVESAFEKYFGDWKATGPKPSLAYPPIHGKGDRTSTTITSTTARQANVSLSQHISLHRGDRDVVALNLANTMLSGEGTGSLLFHDVRKEKGFVYSIDSDLSVSSTGTTFEISYASDPKNVNAAQRTAEQTLERLRRYAPSESDLALAKAMLLSSYIVSLDSYDEVASEQLIDAEDGIDVNDMARYYRRVLGTTPRDVQQAMQKWVDPAKFTRVIVAPQTQ